MRRQLQANGGITNARQGYGIGSWVKEKIRKIIPNELADIAVKAAPFVAPFNPLAAGLMRGVGRFDKRGSISDALKQGLLTYGGGQAARYLGGAGMQTGIDPRGGMGGGMPIGAFIASWELMNLLTFEPKLGHITTFGGNPVNCAASLATLKELLSTDIIKEVDKKEQLLRTHLKHSKIKDIRGQGLMLAIEFYNEQLAKKVVEKSLENGLILFYFLFTTTAIRVTPPLTITEEEIIKGCKIITTILDKKD